MSKMLLRNQLVLAIVVLCNLENVFGLSRVDPLVDSKVGLISGLLSSDGSYAMFMGIPYAKVDEKNPFGLSTPYPKFENTFEAYDDSAKCPQLDSVSQTTTGTLDCLHINVYVPRTATTKNKLPVMVYIHGGLFHRGFAGRQIYDPKYLVQQDVLLVTLNYRLGPYGFMCLDIPEIPGNQGLKDQVLALKWVKDNIEAFGGDVNKITLFGQSAGGHSVDFHLLYGDEKLFQNAILQSGSSLASTVIIDPDTSAPQKIAEQLGLSTDSVTDAVSYLSEVDTDLVIEAMISLNMNFKPCIEKTFDGVEPFITETWINKKSPKVRGKSVLLGFDEYERYSNYVDAEQYIDNNEIFRKNIQQTFDFNDNDLNEMEELVRHFYLGDEKVNEDVRLDLINFDSDFTYIHPIHKSIPRYLESGAKNVYYYMFSYVGERNIYYSNTSSVGAGHGDELGYLFNQEVFQNKDPTAEDQKMIDQMTTMWTNFAKYGDPTPEASDLLPVKWTPVSRENYYYLKMSSELSVESRPVHDRMAFWNLFYMLNEKSQKLYADADCEH